MEEKKLTDEVVVAKNAITDEEIAKAILQQIEYNAGIPYIDEWLKVKTIKFTDILNFIHRLKKENEELKSPKFASWKLKFFNLKEEFDKELSEHEEFTKKAKAEIERLTEEKETAWRKFKERSDECTELSMLLDRRASENAERQKQVDELKEERENMQAVIFGLEEEKRLLQKQVDEWKEENTELYKEHTTVIAGSILQKKQDVKDTAKEIYGEINSCIEQGQEYCGLDYRGLLTAKNIILVWCKKNSIEVE